MKRRFIVDNKAVGYPMESLTAFSVVLVMIAFVFAGVSGFFISYPSNDVYMKSIDIAESLIRDTGMTKSGSPFWEEDIDELEVLGLAMPKIMEGYIVIDNATGQTLQGFLFPFYSWGDYSPERWALNIIRHGSINWNKAYWCFLAGTPVLMADGSYKNIEDIKVGDKVMCYDEKTGEMKVGRVVKAYCNSGERAANRYVIINDAIRVTVDHPFLTKDGWKEARKLRLGEELIGGQVVYSIKIVHEKVDTYGIDVEPYHNYIVGMERTVVHNGQESPGEPSDGESSKAPTETVEKDIVGDFEDFNNPPYNPPYTPSYFGGEKDLVVVYYGSGPDNPPPFDPPDADYWYWDEESEYWYPANLTIADIEFIEGTSSYNFVVEDFKVLDGENGEDLVLLKVKFMLSGDLPYSVLDYSKIEALKKLDYEKAKQALGLDWRYDFAIKITSYNGSVVLEYPNDANYENADVVAKFSRNVIVFKSSDIDDLDIDATDLDKLPTKVDTEQFLAEFEMIVYR